MGLLGHIVTLRLTFWWIIKLFSTASAPFYLPASSVWGFQFLHILTNTSYFPLLLLSLYKHFSFILISKFEWVFVILVFLTSCLFLNPPQTGSHYFTEVYSAIGHLWPHNDKTQWSFLVSRCTKGALFPSHGFTLSIESATSSLNLKPKSFRSSPSALLSFPWEISCWVWTDAVLLGSVRCFCLLHLPI